MDGWAELRDHPEVTAAMRRRSIPGWMPWFLVGLSLLLYPPTLYLGLNARGRLPQLVQFDTWAAVAPALGIVFGMVGSLILRSHPRHAVGWLALLGGFSTCLAVFAGTYAGYSISHHQQLPATGLAIWLRGWLWYPGLTLPFVLVPALFPDGRLPSARWRPLVWAVVAGNLAQLVWVTLSELLFGFPRPDGPWPVAGWLFDPLVTLSGLLWFLSLVAAVAALAVRFHRSTGVARRQLKWFLAAVVFQAVLWLASTALTPVTNLAPYLNPYFDVLIPLGLLTMPVAIGVAILRDRLYDIDIVISRGLVYTALAAVITGAYLLVVVGIGLAVGTGGRPNLALSAAAIAVVAVFIQPLRARLQRLANRLVFGSTADPYAVLAQLSRTPAGDVDHALEQIAQVVARGMGSRRARVRLLLHGDQARTATWPAGASGPFGQIFSVKHGGEIVGEIEAEGSGDQGLTDALTDHAGLALRALRLSAELDARLAQLEAQADELAASRTRLVQAQEAERRRLERDLHDGIQQDLVVLLAKAGLARNQLERDPASAAMTLAELQSSAQHAIADLRSLARGIHPAVLSSRGLVEAIGSIAERMPVGVRVDADQAIRDVRYAPEIEGAAYFVVTEGLANVLKHSGATEASVSISVRGSCLRVAIVDDGRGFDVRQAKESGLRGLRDRVAALGGHVELVTATSGTRLDVSLPTGERVDA